MTKIKAFFAIAACIFCFNSSYSSPNQNSSQAPSPDAYITQLRYELNGTDNPTASTYIPSQDMKEVEGKIRKELQDWEVDLQNTNLANHIVYGILIDQSVDSAEKTINELQMMGFQISEQEKQEFLLSERNMMTGKLKQFKRSNKENCFDGKFFAQFYGVNQKNRIVRTYNSESYKKPSSFWFKIF